MRIDASHDGQLSRLLRAREERAWAQKFFLGAGGGADDFRCVAQISLNAPGWPKRLEGDARVISAGGVLLLEALLGLGLVPEKRAALLNAAGLALLYSFRSRDPSSAAKAKDASVDIEEREEWGRALDIDILTRGGPISRASSGRAPRKCLLCPDEAKICARMTRHPAEELRERVKSLIRNFL